ncbi:hypothetical protein ACPTKS_30760 [Pseudomonas aeruginosa]|uniref:hypothetical protein n=1 Tax=Pseudomonas aeruginosa TaxID=287 RepID=UPI003CC6213E
MGNLTNTSRIAAVAGIMSLACAGALMATDDQGRTGSAAVAADLMAQFYDVPVDKVTVDVKHTGRHTAIAVAKVDGHECTFETAAAPPEAKAPFGWMIASTACNKS